MNDILVQPEVESDDRTKANIDRYLEWHVRGPEAMQMNMVVKPDEVRTGTGKPQKPNSD